MFSKLMIFTLFLTGIITCNSYRILAIFPFRGRSHFHVLEPIAKALASGGHQVDVLSDFKLKEPFPNYTELEFPTSESHARMEFNITMSRELIYDWLFEEEKRMCSWLGHPKMSTLIKNPPKDPPYDAIVVHVLTGYQCFSGIGYLWNIPVVGVVTAEPMVEIQQFIGNPSNLAITQGHFEFYKPNLMFWERLSNVVKTYKNMWSNYNFRSRQESLLQKYLGPDIPSHKVLEKNYALLLVNSHHSFHGIKPKTPALVEIGGINIKKDNSSLEPSLKNLLDDSEHGFIYFSFGTLTVLDSLPQHTLNILYNTFCELSPVRVIMRASNPDAMPKNLCDNVFVFNWLPQQKILQHPNIIAFATHGGGLSSQEVIHYSVPVICIPLFAEQRVNCDIFYLKNMGEKVDTFVAKQEDFDSAFQKVLSNPEYKKSMQKFSKMYWDRPHSPQEAVNYWVEYVIRHGKNVLRSPAMDLEWWQFDLIDVYCFLFLCFILAVVLTAVIIIYVSRSMILLCNSNKTLRTKEKLN